MNETMVTVVGNVASDVRLLVTATGAARATFRLAATPRHFDRANDTWVDGETSWYSITCWRSLAENVADSIRKGEPVVVSGRQKIREWTGDDGRRGTAVEIEAVQVGHDLNRGRTHFTKVTRVRSLPGEPAGADDARRTDELEPAPSDPSEETGAGEAGRPAA